MSILAENWLFLLILALFVALHLFAGRQERATKDVTSDLASSETQPDGKPCRIGAARQSPKWDGTATRIGSNAPMGPVAGRRERSAMSQRSRREEI